MSSGGVFEQRVNIRAENLKVNPEHIVDTVGAGDSFVGAYCASWAMNDSEETRLRIASAAGHARVSRTGRATEIHHQRSRARARGGVRRESGEYRSTAVRLRPQCAAHGPIARVVTHSSPRVSRPSSRRIQSED